MPPGHNQTNYSIPLKDHICIFNEQEYLGRKGPNLDIYGDNF